MCSATQSGAAFSNTANIGELLHGELAKSLKGNFTEFTLTSSQRVLFIQPVAVKGAFKSLATCHSDVIRVIKGVGTTVVLQKA